jgi:hypothetical protein
MIVKRFQLQHPVTMIKMLKSGGVAVVDQANSVRFFKLDPIELKSGFKTSLPQNELIFQGADFSSDGKYVALSVKQMGVAVFNAPKKELLYRLKRHEGEVEALKICDRMGYLATGGQDGQTLLWSLRTGRMITKLTSHRDFVTSIDFSLNGRWIATGSYDRRIFVTDISSLGRQTTLVGHRSAITTLKFISNHRIISADKDGEIIVWDYWSSTVIKRLKKMIHTVTALTTTPDDRFLFVADRFGLISIYDLTTYELVESRFLQYAKPVKNLCYIKTGDYLVVGLETGEIIFHAPLHAREELENLITTGDLEGASKLIEENIFLRYTESYEKLERFWSDAFETAIRLLEEGKKEEAKSTLRPFFVERSKRLIIQKLLNDYSDFEKFKTAVLRKRYPIAYSLVARYTMLEHSRVYKMMENIWKKCFTMAKKIVLQNGRQDKVYGLIRNFRGVPNKSVLIHMLLNEKERYKLFMKLVVQKDFQAITELAKRYPTIKSLDEYKRIEKIAQALKQKAQMEFEEGHYEETINLATKLELFSDYKRDAEELQERAKLYIRVQESFALKRYKEVYAMLEKYPFLEEMEMVKRLEHTWQTTLRRAEGLILKGDIIGLKKLLKPFIRIPQKRRILVTLFKHAYLQQIESLDPSNQELLFQAIDQYVVLFGMDEEITLWLEEHRIKRHYQNRRTVDIGMIDFKSLPRSII